MENHFEEDYLERYTKKVGFIREKKNTGKIPVSLDAIHVWTCMGDLPSLIAFGSILMPNLISDTAYNIVLSWKGTGILHPYADEVWYFDKGHTMSDFYLNAKGLNNDSSNMSVIYRSLNEHFVNVVERKKYNKYFNYTISNTFYKEFSSFDVKNVETLPLAYLNSDFKNKFVEDYVKSCVLIPYKYYRHINGSSSVPVPVEEQYYVELVRRLEQHGFRVYCVINSMTHNISSAYTANNVVYILEENYQKILSMINLVGVYLDFFSDSGSLGLLANADVFRVTERSLYFHTKKYVEDKILNFDNRIKNLFSFLYFGRKDGDLNIKFFEHIINQFEQFFAGRKTQKIDNKTLIKNKEIKITELSKLYVKKLAPKFISKYKEKQNG
jgi:hypothetical protein